MARGIKQVMLVAKNPPADARDPGDAVQSLGRSPGGEHGNPLSIHAWKIPRTEESGGPQSMGSQRVGHV